MTTAWLAGGTGLVGGVLLQQLLDDPHFTRVVSFGRRRVLIDHPKLTQVVTDFGSPGPFGEAPAPEVAFGCLGTTMKKAGSRPAFRAVDHGAVLAFAQAARQRGASTFVHVSSIGADLRSRAFYLLVKGETERDVAQLGFTSTYALRPAMLDGHRQERRASETIGLAVCNALGPLLGRWRPTKVEAIARVAIALAKAPAPGSHVVEAEAIRSPPLGVRTPG
jgi:uncharacterized protein YbjT (DUF2867 family)